MNLEKLSTEEFMRAYDRLKSSLQIKFTDQDADYKEKIKEELLKRFRT
ncbi:hypothetical protein [Mesobacillus campisalis]|nr:hypothetical protein [Mesobacillus campisalis]